MLKIAVFLILSLPTTFARAETCALDFHQISDLHVHQRVALENGRNAGFAVRVFSKTIEGVVRTIAVAGRGPRETKETTLGGRSMVVAFPEVGLTHEADRFGRKLVLPTRSEEARNAAAHEESVAKLTKALRLLMRRQNLTMDELIVKVSADDYTFWKDKNLSDLKADVIASLRNPPPPKLTPAKQLVFDLEAGYVTPFYLRLHRAIFSEARRMAFLTHRLFTYVAGGLIGAGVAARLVENPHAALIVAAGAGVLASQIGVVAALDKPPAAAAELRARNARVARQLDRFMRADPHIGEMLILTERNRIENLSLALARAGFAEIQTTTP